MKHLIAAAALGLMWVTAPSHAGAQSFECDQAATAVERLICADAGLGALDLAMEEAYFSATDFGADAEATIASQLTWLRERNDCGDEVCLFRAYSRRLSTLGNVPQVEEQPWSDADLGLSMNLLANREVIPCDPASFEGRCVVVRGRARGKMVDLLRVQVFSAGLEQTAREEAGFEKQANGDWMTTYGRFEPAQVEEITIDGRTRLMASITCGVTIEGAGFFSAAGECLWGVINDGEQSFLVTTDGLYGKDWSTNGTVDSIRSLPAVQL